MEFPNLGKHCEFEECQQLDFLPFKCNCCKKNFCLEHRTFESHNCKIWKEEQEKQKPLICPLCGDPIPSQLIKGKDKDSIMNEHIETKCRVTCTTTTTTTTNKQSCQFLRCKQSSSLAFVQCRFCSKQYCLKHRFEQDHNCLSIQQSIRTTNFRNCNLIATTNSTTNSTTTTTTSRLQDCKIN
eukprot:TRINITY_DN689_c1_g1_i1.p1 TRINITY_DN689_c1_g1~~TRINITY_DN689_c1_g1_i1.p1  ORF type:complete len:183 (-),score=67.87 TRINITY_DN689_c1_g1_i1:146-694(-)